MFCSHKSQTQRQDLETNEAVILSACTETVSSPKSQKHLVEGSQNT